MKRKRTAWILGAIVSVAALVAVVLTVIAPARSIVIDVSGKEGETVTAHLTIDGKAEEFTEPLPARFAYEAKHVEFQVVPVPHSVDQPITVAMSVDGETVATCSDTAVKGSYQCRGVLGLGSRNFRIGGMTATELAGK